MIKSIIQFQFLFLAILISLIFANNVVKAEYIQIDKPYSSEKIAEVDAGGIVIANLNLWHAGGQNFSGKSRKVIMLNIKRRDQGQLLNYKSKKFKITCERKFEINKNKVVEGFTSKGCF